MSASFDDLFGEVRALMTKPVPPHHLEEAERLASLVTMLLPWCDDVRLDDQLVPYCSRIIDSWHYGRLPMPYVWKLDGEHHTQHATSPELLAVRQAFLSGVNSPLNDLFRSAELRIAPGRVEEIHAEGRFGATSGDQHGDSFGLPERNSIIFLLIYIHSDGDVDKLVRFLGGHRFGRLTKLTIINYGDHPAEAAILPTIANNPTMASLEHLELYDMALHGPGVAALAESPHVRNLYYLGMAAFEAERGCDLDDADLMRLCASPNLDAVHMLDLSWNRNIGDRGVAALLDSGRLGNLVSLDLSITGVTDDTARRIATWPQASSLTNLHIIGLVDEGKKILEQSTLLRNCVIRT